MPAEQSELSDAQRLEGLKRRLVMQLGSLGPGHKETALTICNVGELQLKLRDFREAEESLKNCLKIRKRVVGEYTQETAKTLGLLGQVYHGLGESLNVKDQIAIERNFKLAIKSYRKSLVVLEHLHGGMSPDCMLMLHQIALLCDKTGEHSQALVCKHRCLQIVQNVDKQSLKDIEGHLNHISGTVGNQAELRQHTVKMDALIQELEAVVAGHNDADEGDDPEDEVKMEELQEEINKEMEQIGGAIDGTCSAHMEGSRAGEGVSIFANDTLSRTNDLSQSLSKLINEKDKEMQATGDLTDNSFPTQKHSCLEVEQGENLHEDLRYMSSGSEDDTPRRKRLITNASMVSHNGPSLSPAVPISARGGFGARSSGNDQYAPRRRTSGDGSSGVSQIGSDCYASAEQSDGTIDRESLSSAADTKPGIQSRAHHTPTTNDPYMTHLEAADRGASSKTKQFVIQIDRRSHEELGIAMTRHGVIRVLKPHGLVFLWNEWNPSRQVHMGDRILEVNGKRGEMAIVRELQEPSVLDITVCRESPSDRRERESREHAEADAAHEAGKGERAGSDCVVS